MKSDSILMAAAAVLIAAATGLGAYASHGLGAVLDPDALESFQTAVSYQFFHALGLFGLGAYSRSTGGNRLLVAAGITIAAGIVLFCGGVYASSLNGPGWISGLAPVGGIGLIAGWLLVGLAVLIRPAES